MGFTRSEEVEVGSVEEENLFDGHCDDFEVKVLICGFEVVFCLMLVRMK